MIITFAGFKGGTGKTTSAVHLAALLNEQAPCLLIDGDPNRSATAWNGRGDGLPFKLIDERQALRFARDYKHIVIDTAARPERADMEALADGCDLLVLPTSPDALALDALLLTVDMLRTLGSDRWRVLLTLTPPPPSRDASQARNMLIAADIPVLTATVRRRVAFQKAALAGVTVDQAADPRAGEAWNDYADVLRELETITHARTK
jgi:chromosome partitioning protein